MVLATAQLTVDDYITRFELELTNLQKGVRPSNQVDAKRRQKECNSLTSKIASLKAWRGVNEGDRCSKPNSEKYGRITSKGLTSEGMPELWVRWLGSSIDVVEWPNTIAVLSPKDYAYLVPVDENEYVRDRDGLTGTVKFANSTELAIAWEGGSVLELTLQDVREMLSRGEIEKIPFWLLEAEGRLNEIQQQIDTACLALDEATNADDKKLLTSHLNEQQKFMREENKALLLLAGQHGVKVGAIQVPSPSNREYLVWRLSIDNGQATTTIPAAEPVDALGLIGADAEPSSTALATGLEVLPHPTNVGGSGELGTSNEVIQTDELTYEEQTERHRLEVKVGRSFYEAGCALRELCDRRLYRSTHPNFESYCAEVFGYTRSLAYRQIQASAVVDNLATFCEERDLPLPTCESQVRALIKIEPDQQAKIWADAVEVSEGKVPTQAVVKSIVEELKKKPLLANDYEKGELLQIVALGDKELRKYSGCWAIVVEAHDFSCKVYAWDKTMNCKTENLSRVDAAPADLKRIKSVCDRIYKLTSDEDITLSPTWRSGLEAMGRRIDWSEDDLDFLKCAEERYL